MIDMRRFRLAASVIRLSLMIALTALSVTHAQNGTLTWGEITSPALKGNLIGDSATRPFAVYLPPSYETTDEPYPAVYVLHGFFDDAESLTDIKPTIDSMIQAGEIGE